MLLGNREPRSLVARRLGGFHPKGENLEARELLAIDLGGALPPNLPNIATIPYGVGLGGAQSNGGAGFSVSDVGDVNGDGFDDYLIGAPTTINQNGVLSKGVGNNSRVYLVFGSAAVGGSIVDWLTLNPTQRVGDLGQLGNTANAQQNPITGSAGFPFDGLTLLTSQQGIGAQLGASVTPLGDINGDGFADFMIGAPGGRDASFNNPGTGRAYLIYGGPQLRTVPSKTLDLDNPNQNSGVNFLTFVSSTQPSAHIGAAVAGGGQGVGSDVITNGLPDLAIGAPNASLGGQSNNGAVYLIDGAAVQGARTATIDLTAVGQQGGTAGVVFSGAGSGDQIGAAIAFPGNVDGSLNVNLSVDDLLIGAPAASGGSGTAYLIYGASNLSAQATTIIGINQISLSRIGTPSTTTPSIVAGAVFQGAGIGAQTGFAVAPAGDFNNDGLSDFLIGSPEFNGMGEATLIYGQSVNGTNRITGSIPLDAIPANIPAANFVGATAGDLAGYALAPLGRINATSAVNSEILIGCARLQR